MPNYLNKPISSGFRNTYSSQFVPLPLEQFARTNELNQNKQDAEVNILNQTSDAGHKISGIAKEDNDYVASKLALFDEASKDLSTKDLTQRENQDIAKSLVKGIARDKDLQTIMSNKARYDEYVKNKEDSIKAGTYHPANDNGDLTLRDYLKSGGYKSGKSIDPTIYKYEDVRPIQEQYFNNLRELGADQVGKIGETFYKFGYDGISEARIGKQAAEAVKSYMSTPAAMQEGRVYDLGVRQGTINPKKVPKQAYIFNNFLNAGMERAGMSFKSGLSEAKNADAKQKKEEANLFAGLASNEIPSTLLDGLEVKFDSKGNIQGDGKGLFANAKEWLGSSSHNPLDILSNWKNDTRLSDEQNTRLKSVVVGAKLNNTTPEEYTKVFNKTWAPVIPQPLTGKAIKANNDAFYNGGAGLWSHMILSKDGKGSMGFIEALENEFGDVPDFKKNPKEFKEFLDEHGVQVTGAYAPNKLSARPIEITIGGSTFAADLTNNGKNMNGVSEDDKLAHNLAKLNAGEQIEEVDSKGNKVVYYKDIKTGKILPKIVKE